MPSAYRGVIGARFGCLQMGMGEFGVRSPRECAAGGPVRDRAARRPAWSEPVKSVINRLWTTLVDKWSPSVRQVSRDGRQLNIGSAASSFAGSGEIVHVCEFSTGESYKTELAWTSGRRGGRRSGLPGCRIRRHARCHDTEMTFERAELSRWAGSDDGGGHDRDGGWHDRWGWPDRRGRRDGSGEGVRGRTSVTVLAGAAITAITAITVTTATGCRGGRTASPVVPSNGVVNVRTSGGVARGGSVTCR